MVLWALSLPAMAQAPDYDAFSDQDGNITTEQHGRRLITLVREPGQLEAVHADASKGNARAGRVFRTLEMDYFPDYGRELAERVSRPPCLAPIVRELSGWCVPDWSFLDFLSKDKPGGARLRKAFFEGYAERARQRGLENQLVLSAMNALLGAGVAAVAVREVETAARVAQLPEAAVLRAPGIARTPPQRSPPAPGEVAGTRPALPVPGKWRPSDFRADELDKHFGAHVGEWGAGNITKDAYLKRARDLLSRDPGGEILGHTRPNGDVLRYNTRTNEFAVGARDGTIRTLFRPKDGLSYWHKQVGP